jgi:YesN/AraC family two-component response regulator
MEMNEISDQVLEHIMKASDEEFANFSVNVLANSMNIDRFKLSRQFKRQTKMTLEHFLFREKMNRAAFILKTTETISVKQVAQKVGFCTSDYFIQKFKEYFGVVPGRYRELKAASFL